MRQPNLSDVALFAAVVEAGGFRAAAQKRGMSASSLSDCIRRLESDLGLRLLTAPPAASPRPVQANACWNACDRRSTK